MPHGFCSMKIKLHFIAALIAFACIASFFTATVLVELFASKAVIAQIKSLIVTPGLYMLIPALAITGATGFVSASDRKGRLLNNKKRRMPYIAANGMLILLPCAIVLNQWAAAGQFDNRFYVVQGLELMAGATNLVLMGLNMRDGLKMSGRLRPRAS